MKKEAINIEDFKRATKYRVIFSNKEWKFKKEYRYKAIYSCSDKSTLMTKAIYYISNYGGYLYVHNKDGTLDYLLSNWMG